MPTSNPIRKTVINLGGRTIRQVGVPSLAPPGSVSLDAPPSKLLLDSPSSLITAGAPSVDFPDAFMSYPNSSPISLNGASFQTIENLSFEGVRRADGQPIHLVNCDNIIIRRIDSRDCTMGIVYAENCTNITVEFCRAENIGAEFDFPGWIDSGVGGDIYENENDLNFLQFNGVDGFTIRKCKGRYGNTEDVFSVFNSSNGTIDDVHWEGAILGTETTSDASPAIRWRSHSGTGALIGDGGTATNVLVTDSSFINAAQVGIAIAGGVNMEWNNCVAMSEGASNVSEFTEKASGENIASYIINFYGPDPCSDGAFINCRLFWDNGESYFDGADCGVVDRTGTVDQDATLDIEDYRVSL